MLKLARVTGSFLLAALVMAPALATGTPLTPALMKPGTLSDMNTSEAAFVVTEATAVEVNFLSEVRTFLKNEGLDPDSVEMGLESRETYPSGTDGAWWSLARVHVDFAPNGEVIRQLYFVREFWTAATRDPGDHRFEKVMWHEVHHLKFFPSNLTRAASLALEIPAKAGISASAWKRQWVLLLEPIEELAAERDCVERYRAAFGELPKALQRDSDLDILRHQKRYAQYFAAVLTNAKNPEQVRQLFPSSL